MRDLQAAARVLLHHQHRDARPVHLHHLLEDLFLVPRREPRRGFVQQQHRGLHHQGAPHRQHLPLPARERPRPLSRPLRQQGEQLRHRLEPLPPCPRLQEEPHFQVLPHAQSREHVLRLGNVADALGHQFVWLLPQHRVAPQEHVPLPHLHKTKRRLQQRRLPRSVGAHDACDLALEEAQAAVVQDGHARQVARHQRLRLQQRPPLRHRPSPRSMPRPRCPPRWAPLAPARGRHRSLPRSRPPPPACPRSGSAPAPSPPPSR